MLKAVLFDMDGVIYDSEPIHFEVDRKLLKAFDIDISDNELSNYVGTASQNMWLELKDRYGLKQPVDELISGKINAYVEYIVKKENWVSIPGVVELIKNLRENGIKLALASSSSLLEIGIVLDKLGLRSFFDVVAGGDEVNSGKPAPDIFLLAASRLRVLPEECVVIEDSKNGVSAAKAAHMRCIGFFNPNSGGQDLSLAGMTVDSFVGVDYRKVVAFYHKT